MKKRRRGRRSNLTFAKEIDRVKVCKKGDEVVFILPAMTGEELTEFKINNRKYLRKLKNKIS